LLDNGDLRQRLTVAAAVSAAIRSFDITRSCVIKLGVFSAVLSGNFVGSCVISVIGAGPQAAMFFFPMVLPQNALEPLL